MDSTGARSRPAGKQMKELNLEDGDDEHLLQIDSANSHKFDKYERGDCKRRDSEDQCTRLKGDWSSVSLLTFLYVLQGIPIGLASSIPMILQNRKVTYKQQAIFSLVYWPFSLKLLWAPIVDSVYSSRMGRRKTWLVPTQYLLGFFMLFLSTIVNGLLEGDGKTPEVFYLTVLFFMLNFLAATQDIAVDGWALTMLSRKNVGYASTCNCVGQTAGYFLGNVVFLALESAEFCNKYIREFPSNEGIVTLPSFLSFWGWVFMVSTTLVWILKTEENDTGESADMGIADTYKMLMRIIKKSHVLMFAGILLTAKISFSATDSITGLKLVEAGVPKDKLALLAVPMVPIQMILPLVISKYTAGPRPMDIYLKAIPYRLVFGLVAAAIVWWTPLMHLGKGEFPVTYYIVLLLFYACHQVTLYSIFVAGMAFNARISDADVGGTYMTLLNTLANLGGVWPQTLVLTFVDTFTMRNCIETETADKSKTISCDTTLDGYYILTIFCVFFGFVWLRYCKSKIYYLQRLNLQLWRVTS